MKFNAFLQQLNHAGITLTCEGDALKVQAPKDALTANLREGLAAHKAKLLEMLKETDSEEGAALPVCMPDPARLLDPFPLSDLQLGFYMADDPFMEFHVRPHYYSERNWPDGIDVQRYEQSWNRALDRHRKDIVAVRQDGALHTVAEPGPLRCRFIDLRGRSQTEVEASLLHIRQEMSRSELPLHEWPWIDVRVSIWREQDKECARVHYNHNNFFWDGYGTHQLLEEVERLYREPGLSLPPISLSYRDAVIALDELAASEQGAAARKYWEDRLPHLPGPPEIPVLPEMNRRTRSRLQRREGFLDRMVWHRFKERARAFGLTASNAIFTAYAETLSAWSNNRHFVLSNMMTRRLHLHPEMKDILGNFASLYPLEIDFRKGGTFAHRARNIQEQVIRDARYLQWGGMQVLQAYSRQRGGFGQAPIPFVVGSGLFMEKFKRADYSCLETSQVMLDHQFWELDDGRLYYVWDVLESFFPTGLIDDMQQDYERLLVGLAESDRLWEQEAIPVFAGPKLEDRVSAWVNALVADREAESFRRLDELLPSSASRYPARPALIVPSGAVDYDELADRSARLAADLTAAGVRRGDIVAVAADRGTGLACAVHAVLRAGAAYVPIDPALPFERRSYLIENSETRYVVTESKYLGLLEWPQEAQLLVIDERCAALSLAGSQGNCSAWLPEGGTERARSGQAEDTQGGNAGSAGRAPQTRDLSDLAYVIYTSGSTGRPKGVMIGHRGALNTVEDINERYRIGEGDRILGVSSFGFDLSVYDLFGSAAAGAALVYPDPAQALNPAHWLDLALEHGVSVWNSAPPLASLFAESAELRGVRLPHLRVVLLSGDWIPPELPERLKRIAPNATIVSLGGATEASIWSIGYEIGEPPQGWKSIPYGYPLKNQAWRILDELGRDVPEWTVGELYILGDGLAIGYWNDPEKTKSSFLVDSATGNRMYRTGDLGRYWPGGLIEFLGRKDSQVKIQGYRIELGEIEACLVQHPDIQAAVVTVQRSEPSGSAFLTAHLIAVPEARLDLESVKRYLTGKLPTYMLPRLYGVLERVPLSPNGKVDRKALPMLAEVSAPSSDHSSAAREPQDDLERQLLSLWRRLLKTEAVTVSSDFFELGGQSFEAVRLVGAVQETLGATLSIGDIWLCRTIELLAARIRSGHHDLMSSLVAIKPCPGRNPLFLMHPAGGHVLAYRGLADLLSSYSVYGFQAPGIDGRGMVPASIPELAAIYVRQISNVQPDGVIALGGWSSGGLIAYEAAAQLRLQGRKVSGVFILDCPSPHSQEPVDDEQLLNWFVEDMNLGVDLIESWQHARAGIRTAEEQVALLASLHGTNPEQLLAIYRVFGGIVQGSRLYEGEKTDLDLLVLRAVLGSVSEFAEHPHHADEDWGWRRFTSGLVEANAVKGTHHTLLLPPQLGEIARRIEVWLNDQVETAQEA